MRYDVVLLTQSKYVDPQKRDWYVNQILHEDELLQTALESHGLKVGRKSWDDSEFDWSSTQSIVFRAIWDYFDRYDEFEPWLKRVQTQCKVINPPELIWWNIDKAYLGDLERRGVAIPPTEFLSREEPARLTELAMRRGWSEVVVKPNIAGGAYNTFRVKEDELENFQPKLEALCKEADMMVQEFQPAIMERGEISLMLFGGEYSHSILKTAKAGDYRVQDDYGGTVHEYDAKEDEIAFAQQVMASVDPMPLYGRVDMSWDVDGNPILMELEIIEPELWFRNDAQAAPRMARILAEHLNTLVV